jgi:hypothetical protein
MVKTPIPAPDGLRLYVDLQASAVPWQKVRQRTAF